MEEAPRLPCPARPAEQMKPESTWGSERNRSRTIVLVRGFNLAHKSALCFLGHGQSWSQEYCNARVELSILWTRFPPPPRSGISKGLSSHSQGASNADRTPNAVFDRNSRFSAGNHQVFRSSLLSRCNHHCLHSCLESEIPRLSRSPIQSI